MTPEDIDRLVDDIHAHIDAVHAAEDAEHWRRVADAVARGEMDDPALILLEDDDEDGE